MKIGASTKAFGGKSTQEVAELFGKSGLDTVELCFCQSDLSGFRYNLCADADLPDVNDVRRAKEIYAGFGIDVCAIGVYCNFWCGTDREIFDALCLFSRYCDIAYALGVKTLTTHTGSVFALPASRGFDKTLYEKLYYGFTYAAIEAHKRGLRVGVELCETDAVKTYPEFSKLKKHVFDAVGADTLECIYSPGIQNTEIPRHEIALCHIKDKKSGGKFHQRFGDGDADFSAFFADFSKDGNTPMILEYVNSENLSDTARRFKKALERFEKCVKI